MTFNKLNRGQLVNSVVEDQWAESKIMTNSCNIISKVLSNSITKSQDNVDRWH